MNGNFRELQRPVELPPEKKEEKEAGAVEDRMREDAFFRCALLVCREPAVKPDSGPAKTDR